MTTYTFSADAAGAAAQNFQTTANAMIGEIEDLGQRLISTLSEWRDEGSTAFDAKRVDWQNKGNTISSKLFTAMQTINASSENYVNASRSAQRTYS